jgi:DivIVA domain-containing protein
VTWHDHLVIVLEVCVVVVLIGLTAAAVLGKFGGNWTDPVSSRRREQLPDGDLGRDDLLALRFSQGLRGYRMDQVDAVITRLSEELEDRDRRISALRGGSGAHHASGADAAGAADRSEGSRAEATGRHTPGHEERGPADDEGSEG